MLVVDHTIRSRMKAMENELKEKVKLDRGQLNAWYTDVQRTKVRLERMLTIIEGICLMYGNGLFASFVWYQEEAERYRQRRNSAIDHDKQLRLAVQEIEQVRTMRITAIVKTRLYSYVLLYVKLKNMLNINRTKHQMN
jgi:hypothetical protein